MTAAFRDFKAAFASVLVLGLPDHNGKNGLTSGILFKKHGSHYCTMALWCMSACMQAVAATAMSIEKSTTIAMGSTCKVFVPYVVLHILNTSANHHVTAACRSSYIVAILLQL